MKEWKGNSRAGTRILGVKTDHTTKGREKDDFYATDPVALEKLLDGGTQWLRNILDNFTILEPACGNGNLSMCLEKRGHTVVSCDLKDRGYGITGKDFLQFKNISAFNRQKKFPIFCVILTNPPYSLATEFAEHALEILPDNGLYIALMNITYLASKKRYERIYQYGTLREVYIFSSRINCYRNNDKENYGAQAMIDFAWYVFQKGYKGQPTLYWL